MLAWLRWRYLHRLLLLLLLLLLQVVSLLLH